MNKSIPELNDSEISLASTLVRCSFYSCFNDVLCVEIVLHNFSVLSKLDIFPDTSYYFDYVCENAIVHIFHLMSTIGFCLEEYLASDFIS